MPESTPYDFSPPPGYRRVPSFSAYAISESGDVMRLCDIRNNTHVSYAEAAYDELARVGLDPNDPQTYQVAERHRKHLTRSHFREDPSGSSAPLWIGPTADATRVTTHQRRSGYVAVCVALCAWDKGWRVSLPDLADCDMQEDRIKNPLALYPTRHYRAAKNKSHKKNERTRLVHRLVYETWVGPIPDGHHVDHIDGNPANNHVSNLRAVTAEQNINNPITRVRALDKLAKITEADVRAIRKEHAEAPRPWGWFGRFKKRQAEKYGVTPANIEAIVYRKSWKHID